MLGPVYADAYVNRAVLLFSRIFELENKHYRPIEHSKEPDEHGFNSYTQVLQLL